MKLTTDQGPVVSKAISLNGGKEDFKSASIRLVDN